MKSFCKKWIYQKHSGFSSEYFVLINGKELKLRKIFLKILQKDEIDKSV